MLALYGQSSSSALGGGWRPASSRGSGDFGLRRLENKGLSLVGKNTSSSTHLLRTEILKFRQGAGRTGLGDAGRDVADPLRVRAQARVVIRVALPTFGAVHAVFCAIWSRMGVRNGAAIVDWQTYRTGFDA